MGYTFKRPDPAAMERILTRFPYSPEGAILRLAWLEGLSREEIAALTWDQVQFEDNALTLPDRTVPLAPSAEDCLRERHRLYAQRDPHVIISDRYQRPMPPESVSRLARTALDTEGQKVSLKDLRQDFVIRQLQTHDWTYAARVSGMAVSTLRGSFSQYFQERQSAAPELPPDSEYLLWRIVQQEGSSVVGLALWMGWKLQMQPGEILNLTWSQVDLDRSLLRLPDREIPMGSRLSRLLGDVYDHRKDPAQDRVLLTPGTGKPMDLARLSTVIRTALIRGGLEQLSLGDLSRLSRRGSPAANRAGPSLRSRLPDPRGGHGPAGRVQKRRAEAAEPAPSGRSRGPYRRVLLPGGGRGPAGGPVRRGDGLPRRPRHRRPEGAGGASEPAPRPVYGAAAAHGRPGRAPPHRQAVRPAAPEKAP